MTDETVKGFKTWYRTTPSGALTKWATNSLVHPTAEQAALAGRELSARWKVVREWAVIPYEETPFYLDNEYVAANAVEREGSQMTWWGWVLIGVFAYLVLACVVGTWLAWRNRPVDLATQRFPWS